MVIDILEVLSGFRQTICAVAESPSSFIDEWLLMHLQYRN